MKLINYCKTYVLEHGGLFLLFSISAVMTAVLGFIVTIVTGRFIDFLTIGNDRKYLYQFCIIFAVSSLISIFIGIVNGFLGTKLQSLSAYKMSKDILEHLTEVSSVYTKNIDTAYISQRVNTDSNNLSSFFIDTIVSAVINILIFILSIIILILINIELSFLLLILVLLYFIVYQVFKKKLYIKMSELKETQADFFSMFHEVIRNITFIKSHSVKPIFFNKLERSFKNTLNKIISFQKLNFIFSSCDNFVSILANISVYLIGGIQILNGNMTIGSFTIILSLIGNLINVVKFFLEIGKGFQDSLVSYNRMMEIINIKKQTVGEIKLEQQIESIEFNDVTFQYDNHSIFNKFNYKFKKGNIYYIIGENGTGKTTLLNLIMGHYVSESNGQIMINQVDYTNLNTYFMNRYKIGLSEQDTVLVTDSLINNITLFTDTFDIENIKNLLKVMNFDSYAENLDKGLETTINSQHNNISGGEKQKISIIRQLLYNPDVMIFDEPTSALEEKSKTNFISYLNKIKKDKIIIIVTHDTAIISTNDIKLYLNNESNNKE